MNYLEIFGTFIGIIYLWLEYRASIYLWLAGIIMPAIYIFVYYDAGLYADFGINIYYLIAAIYGWFFWMWGHGEKKSLPIIHTPWKCYLPLFLVFIVSSVAGQFHNGVEHCRNVDAGTQIHRAMVCLDSCRHRLLRTLYL